MRERLLDVDDRRGHVEAARDEVDERRVVGVGATRPEEPAPLAATLELGEDAGGAGERRGRRRRDAGRLERPRGPGAGRDDEAVGRARRLAPVLVREDLDRDVRRDDEDRACRIERGRVSDRRRNRTIRWVTRRSAPAPAAGVEGGGPSSSRRRAGLRDEALGAAGEEPLGDAHPSPAGSSSGPSPRLRASRSRRGRGSGRGGRACRPSPLVASAATGARQPARSAFRRLRSAVAAAFVDRVVERRETAAASRVASPARDPSAPWAGAERSSSSGIRSVIRTPRESRSRPAQARISASARPSSRRRRACRRSRHRDRLEVGPEPQQLGDPARARRRDPRPRGSSRTLLAAWRVATTRTSRTSASRRDGRHQEVPGVLRRDVLQRVDGEVDLVPPKGVVEGSDEDADRVAARPGIRPSVESWSPSVRTRTTSTARPVAFVARRPRARTASGPGGSRASPSGGVGRRVSSLFTRRPERARRAL